MDIRRLAFQVAEKFELQHPFNKDVGTAGEDWYHGFMKRNPEIVTKRANPSADKIQRFNKEKVDRFFDMLESITKEHKLAGIDIYNLDETVITCVAKATESNTSDKSVESGGVTPVEQNKLVTAVMSFSASGAYVPLMLIFPEKNQGFLKGAPAGAWTEYDPSGQMQLNIFIKWLEKFIKFSKATITSPVLLVVDGYRTYLKSLQVLEVAQNNGVHILCLPPFCTSVLQPIQYSFMKTLSIAYTNQIVEWSQSNPKTPVSIDQVFRLFGSAFMAVSLLATPINSFRGTGIWPIDKNLVVEECLETFTTHKKSKNCFFKCHTFFTRQYSFNSSSLNSKI